MGIKTSLPEADSNNNTTIIFGAGLARLSAGFVLSKAGCKVVIVESDSTVGGLAKTIVFDKFRFDLGGHRFFTNNLKIEQFVKDLMDGELLTVPRKSKIYLKNKYFDYPMLILY
jgi:protoporphyrinogen oxidase